jgi:hypothetical protein
MKIINEYLVNMPVQNGPSTYMQLTKIIELENASVYEVVEGNITSYRKITRQRFNTLLENSNDL